MAEKSIGELQAVLELLTVSSLRELAAQIHLLREKPEDRPVVQFVWVQGGEFWCLINRQEQPPRTRLCYFSGPLGLDLSDIVDLESMLLLLYRGRPVDTDEIGEAMLHHYIGRLLIVP
jgi:hypothetical protein